MNEAVKDLTGERALGDLSSSQAKSTQFRLSQMRKLD
jgi:hypothetical protein